MYFCKKNKEIMKVSGEHALGNQANLLRERKGKKESSKTVYCGYCKGFYAHNFFFRHHSKCTAAETGHAVSVPSELMSLDETAKRDFFV
jgi:hypothetical protein